MKLYGIAFAVLLLIATSVFAGVHGQVYQFSPGERLEKDLGPYEGWELKEDLDHVSPPCLTFQWNVKKPKGGYRGFVLGFLRVYERYGRGSTTYEVFLEVKGKKSRACWQGFPRTLEYRQKVEFFVGFAGFKPSRVPTTGKNKVTLTLWLDQVIRDQHELPDGGGIGIN